METTAIALRDFDSLIWITTLSQGHVHASHLKEDRGQKDLFVNEPLPTFSGPDRLKEAVSLQEDDDEILFSQDGEWTVTAKVS